MFRLTTVLVLCLAAAAMGKVRTSKRPGFMMGNPLYDPVWEDDDKIVGGEEVVPGSRPYQLSFQVSRQASSDELTAIRPSQKHQMHQKSLNFLLDSYL